MIEYSAVQRVALPIFNVALLLSFSSVLYGQAATSKDEYATATAKWRQQREKELRWEFGPLYIIGSYEVQERPMQVGSATDNDIVLPDRAPKHAGFFTCIKNEIRFQPEERIAIQLNGKAAAGAVKLKPGQPFAADKLRIGDFTFIGWVGNDQCKVSVRDVQSEYYRNFHGLDWYPIQPTYRVEGVFTPYAEPKRTRIDYSAGAPEEMEVPGYVTFRRDGRELRLEPVISTGRNGRELLFLFRDATSGRATYGGGRWVEAPLPRDGVVSLDFNTAHNPYCAVSPFVQCPMPPKQNQLTIAIEAGEKYPSHP